MDRVRLSDYSQMQTAIRSSAGLLTLALIAACDHPTRPVTGTLNVSVRTIGANADEDGYAIRASGQTLNVPPTGTVTFFVPAGDVQIRLMGLASNCFLTTPDSATAVVRLSASTRVEFTSDCFARSSRILYATSLVAPDQLLVIFDPFQNTKSIIRPALQYLADPSWTSSGATILFSGTDKPLVPVIGGGLEIPELQIFRVNPDGTELRKLTTASKYNSEPSVSPDGSRIVYSRRDFQRAELWIMDSGGNDQRRLGQAVSRDEFSPEWAPSGESIAFTALEPGAVGARIGLVQADGSNQRTLSFQSLSHVARPSWSPDGTKLVFLGRKNGASEIRIYLSNSDGSILQVLEQSRAGDIFPKWSRNGRWILFSRRVESSNTSDLFMASLDGSALIRLTRDGATYGTWKP